MIVTVNQDDLRAINFLLDKVGNTAPKILKMALNETIDGVKTDIVTSITSRYNYKPSEVRKRFDVSKTSMLGGGVKDGYIRLGGSKAYGRGKGMPLMALRAKAIEAGAVGSQGLKISKKKGVRVQIRKGSGFTLIPGAFKAKMGSGHVGIFKRTGYSFLNVKGAMGGSRFSTSQNKRVATSTAVRKTKSQRSEAIKELFTTSAADAIGNKEPFLKLKLNAQKRMDRNLIDNFNYMLGKL